MTVKALRENCKHQSQVSEYCKQCCVKQFCFPIALNDNELSKFEHLGINDMHVLQKGDELFKSGMPFSHIYIIRSGSFKLSYTDLQEQEKIVNFCVPGELMGFDALVPQVHQLKAAALETSSICKISFHSLNMLATNTPSLQKKLLNFACSEQQYEYTAQLRSHAIERISYFLLDLSKRFKMRNLSACEFRLSMSRNDIANFLGLTIETTSRMFNQLQKQQVIELNNRDVKICDLNKLQNILG